MLLQSAVSRVCRRITAIVLIPLQYCCTCCIRTEEWADAESKGRTPIEGKRKCANSESTHSSEETTSAQKAEKEAITVSSAPLVSPGFKESSRISTSEKITPVQGLEEDCDPMPCKRVKYDDPFIDWSEVTFPVLEEVKTEAYPQFIQKVIKQFRGQASDQQFAVLLLVGLQDLHDINSMEFIPQDENGDPLVNNNYIYQPNQLSFGNYIVSRPGFGIDAEITLLEEADSLWRAYYDQNKSQPSWVILYSWFLPCLECTNRIEQKFPHLQYHGTPLKVAYTEEWAEGLYPHSDPQSCIRRLCSQRVTQS